MLNLTVFFSNACFDFFWIATVRDFYVFQCCLNCQDKVSLSLEISQLYGPTRAHYFFLRELFVLTIRSISNLRGTSESRRSFLRSVSSNDGSGASDFERTLKY